VGVHPAKIKEKVDIKQMARMMDENVVAVGEVGLDKKRGEIERQKKALIDFIELANELSLPLVLHCRGAEEEMMKILKENKVEKGGVWHCFLQSGDVAEEITKMGFFLSFSPSILRKDISAILEKVSFDRILLETDSPYIGREPSDVLVVARKIAKEASLTLEDVARITSTNAYLLFGIGEKPQEGVIAYKIRESLYLNITNRCTNDCVFCVRRFTDFVKGHNLRLKREPDVEQIINAVPEPSKYEEIVFCGYGEPTLRWEVVEEVAKILRSRGAKRLRLNTNGQAALINGEDVLKKIPSLFDTVSVSLNTADEVSYERICRPSFEKKAFPSVLHFIKTLKECMDVVITVVDYPEVRIEACKELASSLSLPLKIRRYKEVG
jgi:TatD DNase family protein